MDAIFLESEIERIFVEDTEALDLARTCINHIQKCDNVIEEGYLDGIFINEENVTESLYDYVLDTLVSEEVLLHDYEHGPARLRLNEEYV